MGIAKKLCESRKKKKEELKALLNYLNGRAAISGFTTTNDLDVAKSLLIHDPEAWYKFGDEIKEHPDLIYYYQPLGILNISATQVFVGHSIDGTIEPFFGDTNIIPCAQKGFTLQDGFQIPNIQFPLDFDLEKYKNIQAALMQTAIGLNRRTIKSGFAKAYEYGSHYTSLIESFNIPRFPDTCNSTYHQVSVDSLLLFNRFLIEQLVNNPESRLIFTNKN